MPAVGLVATLDPGIHPTGAPGSLNGGTHAANHALRDEIFEAVREAGDRGAFSRVDIVRRFAGRAGQSTLFGHVKTAVDKLGLQPVKHPIAKADPVLEAERKTIAARASSAIERAEQPQPTDKPVDMIAELHAGLRDLDLLIALAKSEEGRVRNARLLATAVDLKGRAIERMARVRASLSDESEAADFLRQVTAAIMAEPPEVRARILGRLRGVTAAFGL